MIPRCAVFACMCALLLMPTHINAQYARTLRLGVSGEDVRALQRLLNQNTATQIADMGPGSTGQETGFFGTKTRDAVMRFQELYRSEILVPAGVSAPTGIAGARTLAKAASLTGGSPKSLMSPAQPLAPPVPALPPLVLAPTSPLSFAHSPVAAFGVSKSVVVPGEPFELYGSGFDNETVDFVIGSTTKLTVLTRQPGVAKLSVPDGTPTGSYTLSLMNIKSGKLIDAGTRTIPLAVSAARRALPQIISVEPQRVSSAGGELKITARNLSGDIYLLTPFGPVKTRRESDEVIIARLSDSPGYATVVPRAFASLPAAAFPEWKISLMIATDAGISEETSVIITR